MNAPSIDTASLQFKKAESELAQAEQGVVADKQSRTGIWGQLVDAVIDTPAEKELKSATERFQDIEQ